MRLRLPRTTTFLAAATLLSLGLPFTACAAPEADVVEEEPPTAEDYSHLSVEEREDLWVEWMDTSIAPATKALKKYAKGEASQQQALERAALASQRIALGAGPFRYADVPDFEVHARACAEEIDQLRAYAAAGDTEKLLATMELGAPFSCKRCHDAVEEVR